MAAPLNANCRIGRVRYKPGAEKAFAAAVSDLAGGSLLPAYDAGAGSGRRQSAWLASSGGVNTVVIAHATTLRNRARDQIRKNPWASQIIDRFVSNAVGTGIKPQSKHPEAEIRRLLHETWLDWTDESDPEEIGDFYEQQALAVRGIFESGEVFLRKKPLAPDAPGRRNDAVPLQVQVLEADHCPLSENRFAEGGNVVIAGIEFEPSGRRAAYWMYREHPGEFLAQRPRGWELERIPAEEICHVFVRQRPGQVRGVPRLASVLARLQAIDEYENAELLRKKIAALFAGFIIPGVGEDGTPLVQNAPDAKGAAEITLEPGGMEVLPPGAEIKFSEPAEVGTSYDPFMKWNLRAASSGGGVTYEMVTGDLSDVNFSSIRAGLLEFRRGIEQFQFAVPVYQMNRPVWLAWLEQAALAGILDAGDFLANRRAYERVEWIPQGWDWVDPEKEQRAAVRSARAGFTSRRRIVSARGDDIETIDREIAEDKARADALGLVLDSDPSVVSQTGTTQAVPKGSEIPDAEAAKLPAEDEGEDTGDGSGDGTDNGGES